jgi:phosphoglucomutase
MHGVGLPFAEKVFNNFGLEPFYPVPEQMHPDPEFPTVTFPNPEEVGALERAMKFADSKRAAVIFANDPDADRLAVAEKLADGSWRQFNGNEIGVLLASFMLEKVRSKDGKGYLQ